jgi:hypothetical protein
MSEAEQKPKKRIKLEEQREDEEVKVEAKREVKVEAKEEVKVEVKEEAKVEAKEEAKVEAKEEEAEVEATNTLKNDAGETYFKLSPKKRATIRKYKGSILVDVREVCFIFELSIY